MPRRWLARAIVSTLALGPAATVVAQDAAVELRLGMDAGAVLGPSGAATASTPAAMTLLGRQAAGGARPRQRNPELSSDQLVVVAEDAAGQILDWQAIPDPRVLRAEEPGPSGELRGTVLHRATAELLVTIPSNPAIAVLRLYHPRWTPGGFVLDQVGVVQLP